MRRRLRGLWLTGRRLLVRIAGDVLPLIKHTDAGMEFVVIGVFQGLAHVHVFTQVAVAPGEMEDAIAVRVNGKPILAVDELAIGNEGR